MKIRNQYFILILLLLGSVIIVSPVFGENKKPENNHINNITIENHQNNNSNTNSNANSNTNSQEQSVTQNSTNNTNITNDNNSNISNSNSITLTNNALPQTIPLQIVTVAPVIQTKQLPQTGSAFLSLFSLFCLVPLGFLLRKLAY